MIAKHMETLPSSSVLNVRPAVSTNIGELELDPSRQVSYTPEAVAALVREPQDRIEAVRPAIEALGGKLVAADYPFGEYDAVVLYEAPDDTSAASFALAIAAGGAAKSAKTTRLLNGQEWIESLRKVQGSQYRPPQ